MGIILNSSGMASIKKIFLYNIVDSESSTMSHNGLAEWGNWQEYSTLGNKIGVVCLGTGAQEDIVMP